MFGHRLGRVLATTSLLVIVSLLGALAPIAYAECPGNALVNGGFEGGFTSRGANEVVVANGWTPFWQDGPFAEDGYNRRPEYKDEDAARFGNRRVREGAHGQKWGSVFATHKGGVFQQVNVAVGSSLTLTAWAQAWSSTADDPATSTGGKFYLSIGIDPTGGTDWNSPNVVWSPVSTTLDQWVQLTVKAKAAAGTVTVYLRGDAEWRNKHNDAYFDDVCLAVVTPPPPPTNTPRNTNTPTITPTPSVTPTPTITETPTITPTPLPGLLGIYAFEDANGDGVRDADEPLLAGARFELLDTNRTSVATYETTGAGEPYYFGELRPGTYLLTEIDPPGYTSASPNQLSITVGAGASIVLGFADQVAPTPTPTLTLTPTNTRIPPTKSAPTATLHPTPLPVQAKASGGLGSISGILVALVAVVLPLGLRFLRSRQPAGQ